jgi:hypothetical protein
LEFGDGNPSQLERLRRVAGTTIQPSPRSVPPDGGKAIEVAGLAGVAAAHGDVSTTSPLIFFWYSKWNESTIAIDADRSLLGE